MLPLGHGIHARPAAAIVACARRFDASIELATDRTTAPATSAVALMTLGLGGGDRATLRASGADAEAALEALAVLIERELDSEPEVSRVVARSSQSGGRGVTAVPGIAIGSVARVRPASLEPPEQGRGIAVEKPALDAALAEVSAALQSRAASANRAQADIARAHLALLDDPRLYAAANEAIEKGASAGAAWREAIAPDLVSLRAVVDDRIAGRADDLVDLERQVIASTLGASATIADLPNQAILVAEDLLPSELMSLDISSLAGIALAGGGPTSHVAIIAAAHAIPMVVALGEDALMLEDASRVVLDAGAGTIVAADEAAEAEARDKIRTMLDRRAAVQTDAAAPCHLADGTRIEIFANLGSLEDAELAMTAGAEGCGLLRTELLFLDRDAAPEEEEQLALYSAIAARLEGRPLIIRTLDIGGDKPVRYLRIRDEENPALGLRGIRVGLEHPHLLDTQLRAILRAGAPGQCRILVPMVSSVDELLTVRSRAEAAAADLGYDAPVLVEVMIETPAAAIAADLLAPFADFFAIGTNDLAQYTLAMDRGNPAVASQVDALHPAVLRLIQAAASAGAAHGRPVGVCGGLASDLVAAPILIGLGVSELSAVPGVIPELKARVRTLTRVACAELASKAVQQSSAMAVRALAARVIMKSLGLGSAGFQRLGRALMLPIAVLPIAGLLLRLGQPDLLNIAFVQAAGNAIFQNLGLLFAIGVAVGFARDGNGAAALAGAVCFLVAKHGAETLLAVPPDTGAGLPDAAKTLTQTAFTETAIAKLSVPLGTISGLIAGTFYNRFGEVKLPEFLAFFGGRRFVPIISGVAGLVLALVFGLGWSTLNRAIDDLSYALVAAGPLGLFAYGVLNRLLLITGLHHILNNIVWFVVGDFHGATGDLNRFFAGDPTAGSFMSGFFPVMIFGLPAACLAMYRSARPERRREVGGMLLSLALTAMLTGVTEPIEFTFMFLAPFLYVVHAILTGIAMALMSALGVKLGFGFSAGLLDYVLNYGRATKPLLLLPVGAAYALLYYGLFRFFIVRLNLATPGREPAATPQLTAVEETARHQSRAGQFVAALGGMDNLDLIDACTTRLRLVVKDQARVDETSLKQLGALGLIRPSSHDLQVIVGPTADQLAREMRAVGGEDATKSGGDFHDALLIALGGQTNVRAMRNVPGRTIAHVLDLSASICLRFGRSLREGPPKLKQAVGTFYSSRNPRLFKKILPDR